MNKPKLDKTRDDFTYAYLPLGRHSGKPRTSGLTVVVDGMDAGFISLGEVEQLGDFSAPYIDYLKLGWLIPRLVPQARLIEKIAALHKLKIKVFSGGMALEYALLHDKAEELMDECAELDIDAIEVSTSGAYVTLARQRDLVKEIKDRGFEVFVELGRKGSAFDPSATDVRSHLEVFQNIGVARVVIESERIASMEEKGVLDGFLEELSRQDCTPLVLELPYGISFPQLLPIATRVFGVLGPEANVANVDIRHVLALETVRTGTCFGDLFGLVPAE